MPHLLISLKILIHMIIYIYIYVCNIFIFMLSIFNKTCKFPLSLLAPSRCHIWSLRDSNGIETHNHLNPKLILNYLARVAKWFSVHLQTKWLWVWILLLSLTYLPVYEKNCFLTATADSWWLQSNSNTWFIKTVPWEIYS